MCAHGGGAFSGKDATKVDRSAAYYARYVAKNIVVAGLCDKIEIQVSYAIGISKPVSLCINTFNTNKFSADKILNIIYEVFVFSSFSSISLIFFSYSISSSFLTISSSSILYSFPYNFFITFSNSLSVFFALKKSAPLIFLHQLYCH